jgi:hypothetical protein
MNQTTKTLIFAGVAAASVAIAASTQYAHRPTDLEAFSDVGEEFYPDFEDPNAATGLRVAAYDDESGKTNEFVVEFKNGLWRIPTHHGYPADGKERLAKTAASMVGVIRQALVERSKTAQKQYDVLDPLDKDLGGTEGRGDRITLYKGDDVLVDFIVGRKAEGSENLYYVRRADEDRIYMADLGNFTVSTKFADWIQQDVLDVARNDIRDVVINRYQVDEAQGKVISEGQLMLHRDDDQAEWKLDGLKPETEKLKTSEVNTMLAALDDLQIVGVRPKPPQLSAGLKSDGAISIDPFVQRDLMQKGFFISGKGQFISNEGEVNVGTDAGVVYMLGFGEEFSGSEIDIEIGQKSAAKEAAALEKKIADKPEADGDKKTDTEKKPDDAKKPDASQDQADEKDENKTDDESEKPAQKKSRYLFVTVDFEKSLLGPAPVAPQKPEPPAETKTDEKAQTEKPSEKTAEEKAKSSSDAKPIDKKSDDQKESDQKDGDQKQQAEKSKESLKPDPQQIYKEALADYEIQKEVYETKKKEYEDKIEAGKKRVAELNRRFADWYYVISEDVFDRLKLQREALVEKVEPPKVEEKPATETTAPGSEAPASKAEMKPAEKPEAKPDSAKAAPQSEAPPKTEIAPASKPEAKPKEPEPKGEASTKPAASTKAETQPEKPAADAAPESASAKETQK